MQNLHSNWKIYLFHWQDLVDDLKGELGGNFETLIVGLMSSPLAYDVKCLRDAIKVSARIVRYKDDEQAEFIIQKQSVVEEMFCLVWPLGGRNGWEGPGGDPGLQDVPAGEGDRRCLQTRYIHTHTHMAVSHVLNRETASSCDFYKKENRI